MTCDRSSPAKEEGGEIRRSVLIYEVMHFTTRNSPEFAKLKAEIEQCPRLSGYYLIDLVDIPGFPEDEVEREALLDELIPYFDDQEWPPPSDRPADQTWRDYETSREVATAHIVEALVGGPEIGHTRVTIAPEKARQYWERFEALFSNPRHYYVGLGLGDSKYAYLHGVVVIDNSKAGALCIVDGD